MSEQLYKYVWGSNAIHRKWKDRIVRIIGSMGSALNSCEIEDVETGARMVISRNALRKVKP